MSGPANGRPGAANRLRAEVVRERLADRRRTFDYWIRAELEAELRQDLGEVNRDDGNAG